MEKHFISPDDIRIGTVFTTRQSAADARGRKPLREHTVTDILKTYDRKGAHVETRYVAEHNFCGQKVTCRDFVAVTIQRGFVSSPEIRKFWHGDGVFVSYTAFELLSADLMRRDGSGVKHGPHNCDGMEFVGAVKVGSFKWSEIEQALGVAS